MTDFVNRPPHYAELSPEPIDVIEAWGLPFHEATILQYVIRWRKKGGVEDLRKARFYIERLIDLAGREVPQVQAASEAPRS
jgi:hypothetical protein